MSCFMSNYNYEKMCILDKVSGSMKCGTLKSILDLKKKKEKNIGGESIEALKWVEMA